MYSEVGPLIYPDTFNHVTSYTFPVRSVQTEIHILLWKSLRHYAYLNKHTRLNFYLYELEKPNIYQAIVWEMTSSHLGTVRQIFLFIIFICDALSINLSAASWPQNMTLINVFWASNMFCHLPLSHKIERIVWRTCVQPLSLYQVLFLLCHSLYFIKTFALNVVRVRFSFAF